MAVTGRKPKPRDQIRHRVKPVHDWHEYDNVPFEGAPKLPPSPKKPPRLYPPEPQRPLGQAGREVWERVWFSSTSEPDVDRLLQLCEQLDERAALRVKVLRDGDFHDRNGLRALDAQITAALTQLADSLDDRLPDRWPAPTRRWWRAISRLPHCVGWTDADWQFAMDTACLVAAFHLGDHRWAQEIRRREAIMGTTVDARRDLRIRYVEPVDQDVHDPSVTAMSEYRRSISAL